MRGFGFFACDGCDEAVDIPIIFQLQQTSAQPLSDFVVGFVCHIHLVKRPCALMVFAIGIPIAQYAVWREICRIAPNGVFGNFHAIDHPLIEKSLCQKAVRIQIIWIRPDCRPECLHPVIEMPSPPQQYQPFSRLCLCRCIGKSHSFFKRFVCLLEQSPLEIGMSQRTPRFPVSCLIAQRCNLFFCCPSSVLREIFTKPAHGCRYNIRHFVPSPDPAPS